MRKPIQVLILPYKYEKENIYFLIFKRADLKVWQGIAGGVEENETVLMAAKREAFEEAGIPINKKYIRLESKSTIPVNFIYGNFYWGNDVYNAVEYCYGVCVNVCVNSCGNGCGGHCGGNCTSSDCSGSTCLVGCTSYCLHDSCNFSCGGDETIENTLSCSGQCMSSSCSATGQE